MNINRPCEVGNVPWCANIDFETTRKSHGYFKLYKTHSQMLGKFEYTGGPIFKVVLEC